jgi:hypothetical protein
MFKKIKLSLIYLAFLSLFLLSCSSDNNSTNPNNNNTLPTGGTLTATISGAINNNFSCNTAIYILQSMGEVSQTVISATVGNQTNGMNITFQLINLELKPQTITISEVGFSGSVMIMQYVNSSVKQFIAMSGTINITENTTTKIKGTFEFSGGVESQGTYFEAKNGTFEIKK